MIWWVFPSGESYGDMVSLWIHQIRFLANVKRARKERFIAAMYFMAVPQVSTDKK